MSAENETIYFKNWQFKVTASDVTTKNSFFPIEATTGRIRKDFLFGGLALAAFMGAALYIYFDLWTLNEKLMMAALIGTGLIILPMISVLQIDAKGFPSRFYIAPSRSIRKVFAAITIAKAASRAQHSSAGIIENNDDEDE